MDQDWLKIHRIIYSNIHVVCYVSMEYYRCYHQLLVDVYSRRLYHQAYHIYFYCNTIPYNLYFLLVVCFQTLHHYCCFVVWITFRRKHFDLIKKEMGTTLRSDTFNPAIRVKNAPENGQSAVLRSYCPRGTFDNVVIMAYTYRKEIPMSGLHQYHLYTLICTKIRSEGKNV